MPKKSKTYSFTSRKKSFGNYWLVYSNKVRATLKLISDREVAHWVLNLEFNPDVQSFQFDDFTLADSSIESLSEINYRVLVRGRHGIEYHFVSVMKSDVAEKREQEINSVLWRTRHIKYRHVSDTDLTSRRNQIFPLLRLSSFLTSCKDQYVSPGVEASVNEYLQKMRRGSIAKYLADLSEYNKQVLMLCMYRLANSGAVLLHFDETPFKFDTRWELTV